VNILITAASSAQAYKLQRFLNTDETIILGDSVDLPVIQIGEKKFVKLPQSNSASFAHLLLSLCLNLEIAELYPLKKAEVVALAESRQLFDEYGIRVMVPSAADINNYLVDGPATGDLLRIDQSGGQPDRGVFVQKSSTSQLQLFTVD
jgi:hypothetical protein